MSEEVPEQQFLLPQQVDVTDFQNQDANEQLMLGGLVGGGHGDVWGVAPVPHHHQQQQQLEVCDEAHGSGSSALGWHRLQQLVELDLTYGSFGMAACQELAAGLGAVLRKLGMGRALF